MAAEKTDAARAGKDPVATNRGLINTQTLLFLLSLTF